MSHYNPITADEVLDSRDVIARIEYLREVWCEAVDEDDDRDYAILSEDDWAFGLGAEDARELVALMALAAECEDHTSAWLHGETLIRESYFTEYIQELVNDCYETPQGFDSSEWPWRHASMDWEAAAEEAKTDYAEATYLGETYYIRSV